MMREAVRHSRLVGVCRAALGALALGAALLGGGCRAVEDGEGVRPKSLRDVPAERLAFRFEADVEEANIPEQVREAGAGAEKIEAIARDFETRRPAEELLRTVLSPDGQRALALYATSETEGGDFRMDLYSPEGAFVRNVLPADMIGVFRDAVAWSPDGRWLAFVGLRNPATAATPDPGRETTAPPIDAAPAADPAAAAPVPTVAPAIAPVQVFGTEQVYLADRDGLGLRPLTTREGLIYFELAWSPDAQALAALACREDEWAARKARSEMPAGRPRVITLEGRERLLDDRLAGAPPAWSPDSSKVATAFDKTVAIYDATAPQPTGANLPLDEQLRAASEEYDARVLKNVAAAVGGQQEAAGAAPAVILSFNPVVRLAWVEPEVIFVQTAYVRLFPNEPAPTVRYLRWHGIRLYAQEAALTRAAAARQSEQ